MLWWPTRAWLLIKIQDDNILQEAELAANSNSKVAMLPRPNHAWLLIQFQGDNATRTKACMTSNPQDILKSLDQPFLQIPLLVKANLMQDQTYTLSLPCILTINIHGIPLLLTKTFSLISSPNNPQCIPPKSFTNLCLLQGSCMMQRPIPNPNTIDATWVSVLLVLKTMYMLLFYMIFMQA